MECIFVIAAGVGTEVVLLALSMAITVVLAGSSRLLGARARPTAAWIGGVAYATREGPATVQKPSGAAPRAVRRDGTVSGPVSLLMDAMVRRVMDRTQLGVAAALVRPATLVRTLSVFLPSMLLASSLVVILCLKPSVTFLAAMSLCRSIR